MAAHRPAFGVTLEMLKNPPPGAAQMLQAFRPVMEREVFILGGARGPLRQWPLEDFFDGLETAELHSRGEMSPAVEESVANGHASGAS